MYIYAITKNIEWNHWRIFSLKGKSWIILGVSKPDLSDKLIFLSPTNIIKYVFIHIINNSGLYKNKIEKIEQIWTSDELLFKRIEDN